MSVEQNGTLGDPEIGSPEISLGNGLSASAETGATAVSAVASVASSQPGAIAVPQADGGAPAVLTTDIVEPQAVTSPFEPRSIPDLPTFEPVAPIDDLASVSPTLDIPPSPPEADGETPRLRWWQRRIGGWRYVTLGALALLVAAVFAASVIRTPYYRIQPGTVYDTIERVEAPGELVFVPEGNIGFVTVSQTANITPLQWLDAKLDENVRIRHEDDVRGSQTADEARATDLRRMQVSKDAAVVVALQRLGYELVITPVGVEVAQVIDCTAADGTLGTGDLIVGVNGVDTPDGERLVAALLDIGVGQDVELLVERIDPTNPTQSMRTDLVGLTLGSADDSCIDESIRSEEARPFIGIMTETMYEEELPIDIDIRTGRVGGPSAGLAFTLAIMDVLTDGELTNGLSIVATGSITRDGEVRPVGGIHQKTVAAERAGTDLFLVPACCDNFIDRETGEPLDLPSNIDEALEHADEMRVVGVRNLDDALRAIGELGGDVERFLSTE